jgi:hypothetical protein
MRSKTQKLMPRSLDPAQIARREHIFSVYRDLGPTRSYDRLLAAVAEKHGSVSKRSLANWSRQHSWQERIAEHDSQMEQGLQGQSEILDPNFDIVDALLKAAHLTLLRVLRSNPVVRTAQDAKALVDAAANAMKLAELLRAKEGNPKVNEESRRHMWEVIDRFEAARRAELGISNADAVPEPKRSLPPPSEAGTDTSSDG